MGIVVALTAAFFWALAARFYGHSTAQWSILLLNFTKNALAVVVLGALLWALPTQTEAELHSAFILVVSGVIGIGIGDTALFAALKRMGEQNTLLIAETLAPLVVVTFGFLLLSESLSLIQIVGMFFVLLATDLAIGIRHQKRLNLGAVGFAIIAAFCQATGALISRFFLTTTDIGVLESAVWRLLGGLLFATIGLLLLKVSGKNIRYQALTSHQTIKLLVAVFLGTIIGVFMLQWSLELLPAGIAQTLLTASPLFAVMIAFVNRETISKRQFAAVCIGCVGVAVISLG